MLKYIPLLALALAACQTDAPAPPEASGVETAGSPLIEVENATQLVDQIIEEGNEATVLNFWATWCGPCRIEFPDLMEYDAAMEEEGVEVRFVSVDDTAVLDKVHQFLSEQGVTERSYISPDNTTLAAEFGPAYGASLPTTLILDSGGIVRAAWTQGIISPSKLDSLVAGVRDGSIDITTQL